MAGLIEKLVADWIIGLIAELLVESVMNEEALLSFPPSPYGQQLVYCNVHQAGH